MVSASSPHMSGPHAARSVSPAQAALAAGLGVAFAVLDRVVPSVGIWSALALFLLGVPHGAVERHPDSGGGWRRLVPTPGYTALYLVVGLLLFCSWLINPAITLGLFLLLSAVHFGHAEPRLRLAGLWVVLGSLLMFREETLGIFSLMTGVDWTAPMVGRVAFWLPLAAGTALILEAAWKRDLPYAALLLGLFALVPPVGAVATYYFAVHSLREWGDARSRLPEGGAVRRMVRLYAPFSLPVLAGGSGLLALVGMGAVPLLVAVGLGVAVASPHMIPLERWMARGRGVGPAH